MSWGKSKQTADDAPALCFDMALPTGFEPVLQP
jgi:hypothetical protein